MLGRCNRTVNPYQILAFVIIMVLSPLYPVIHPLHLWIPHSQCPLNLSHPSCPQCYPLTQPPVLSCLMTAEASCTAFLNPPSPCVHSFLQISSVAFSENQLSSCQLPAELNFFQFLKRTEPCFPSTYAVSSAWPLASVSQHHRLAASSCCSPRQHQAACPLPRFC